MKPASPDTAVGAPPAEPGAGAQWLEQLKWDADGLVAAVAQDLLTQKVLMVAWMNREALAETARSGRAVYWSRSRGRLWRKGEESGNVQRVHEIRSDCDGDAVLLRVEQGGGIACHTGREACFYNRLDGDRWVIVEPVLADPATLYGKPR